MNTSFRFYSYGSAKVAVKSKVGMSREEEELKKLGENAFKPAVELSKKATAKREASSGSG